MIMNGLHSLTIAVMKGEKKQEAKGIEKRTLERSESMSRSRAPETTETTESLETAATAETPETAGISGTPGRCGITAERPRRVVIPETLGQLAMLMTTETGKAEMSIGKRTRTRKNRAAMAETT